MSNSRNGPRRTLKALQKSPTGIQGLDEITAGGLPRGRPTLVCGGAGCGKTLLAMEFLVHGVQDFDEPGVFVSFEESASDLIANFASMGFDLPRLVQQHKLALDYVHVERSEIEETGAYDLGGLFIRLEHAIDTVGAKRVVIDTVEALFAGLADEASLRGELRRLFRWLKEKGVTAIITGERGEKTLTRYGLEEYVADCVIVLDHPVTGQVSTRRLRIVKYRGSVHGTNEYPFLIDTHGLTVLPISSLGLAHPATNARVSSGIPALDAMLGGVGYYRGSSVLVSGPAGSGKTSMAGHFAEAASRRGERCLWFAFEESPAQIERNLLSIGLDLARWRKSGRLQFHAVRPTAFGLEMHLATMTQQVLDFKPKVVIVDPVSNLTSVNSSADVAAMLTRLIDFFKTHQITTLFTNLVTRGEIEERTQEGVSSLMDTWLLLRDIESNGERNRGLYVLKARGMAHSNQIREFLLTGRGIDLLEPYLGPAGTLLTGTARAVQVAQEKADVVENEQAVERQQRELERRCQALEAQIAGLQADLALETDALGRLARQRQQRGAAEALERAQVAHLRRAEKPAPATHSSHVRKGGAR
jgi:circadian clock protein KaiC